MFWVYLCPSSGRTTVLVLIILFNDCLLCWLDWDTKNKLCVKLVFLYTIQYQIMNNVSIHVILTKKKLVKQSLRFLLPLIFASRCLPYKTPAVVCQQIWTPFSTVPVYNLGYFLMEPFTMFIGEGSHVFRGKKNFNWNAENKVSMTCFTPQHCRMKLAPAQFHPNFPLFHRL